tara:strand:+ start:270 stop:2000 length:1731 start_codon:yes stop_codon:yes gene_type:complete
MSLEQQINKAKSLEKKGAILEAINIYKSILTVFPKNIRVQERLAALSVPKKINNVHPPQEDIDKLIKLFNQRHYSSVVDQTKAFIRKYPNIPVLWSIMGSSAAQLGMFDKSEIALRKSLALDPNNVANHNNLGNVLREQKKFVESIEALSKAISLNPNYYVAYFNMGITFTEQGKLNEAIRAYKKSILIKPDYIDAYCNMGVIFQKQGKLYKSLEIFKNSILINQNFPAVYNNMGNVYRFLGNLSEAIKSYKKAISLKADYGEAYNNLSFVYNLKGNFQKGLEFYEWRLRKDIPTTKTPRDHLIWDGKESLLDKKYLVYEEQGLGDVIQFCRYLPLLKQKGAKVIFKVKPKMHTLLKNLDEDIVFVDRDLDDNSIDFETPLMSLPYLFNTNLNTIPSMTSYLSADDDKIISWKKHLAKDSFKVGICWQGSKNKIDFERSFPLTLFEDLSKLSNVELISLHKGEGEKQIEDINFDLTVLGSDFDNGEDAFVDTAAVMANCDLIITSDTAIAHLAGALGSRAWVVLKKTPDWRWMLDRNDSPWYPNMKLYRQKERDNWDEVFETIKKDLESLIILNEN